MERCDYVNNYNLKFGIAAEEYQKWFTLLKVEPKYIYENGKKTERYDAYTMTFFAKDGSLLKVHINKDNAEDWPTMVNYQIVYDEEKTKPYSQNGFVKYTVWAKEIKRLERK